MSIYPKSKPLSVEQLLEAVESLSPDERREFQRRLPLQLTANGHRDPDEDALIRAARSRLSSKAERRLRKLIARSERGLLTTQELADYQTLAQESQRLDAARIEALTSLARLKGRSIQAVKAALDTAASDIGVGDAMKQ